MDGISSGPAVGAQLYAMKKATEIQSQRIMKVLESTRMPDMSSVASASASATGIGQNLDIRG